MISEEVDESLGKIYLDLTTVRQSPFIRKNAIIINAKAICEIMMAIEEDFSINKVTIIFVYFLF